MQHAMIVREGTLVVGFILAKLSMSEKPESDMRGDLQFPANCPLISSHGKHEAAHSCYSCIRPIYEADCKHES